jgi:hypothetical protein
MAALLIGTAVLLAILALIGLAFVVAVKRVIDGALAAGTLVRDAVDRRGGRRHGDMQRTVTAATR